MATLRSQHLVVTLSGAAEALPVTIGGKTIRWMSLQPGAANANPIFIGGEGVSASVYGTRLPIATAGVPPPPHVIAEFDDGSLELTDVFVIGTASEKLHIHALVCI